MSNNLPEKKFRSPTILIIISFVILIISHQCKKSSDQGTREGYLQYRAEGLPLSKNILSGCKYIRKYINKRTGAPDSLVAYFKRQEEINQYLLQFNDQERMLSLAFVGDIMWIRDNWDDFLSEEVRSYLAGKDMVFGNLETPIDTKRPVPSFFPDYFSFNSSSGLISSFSRDDSPGNILTAVSVANNHALDKGIEGLERTKEFLRDKGIGYSGTESGENRPEEYFRITKNGVRVGFYAAAWGLNKPEDAWKGEPVINIIPGIAPFDEKKIDLSTLQMILRRMAEDSVNVKILSLHWGYEYELFPDTGIMKIARTLARSGADIIIGSHPHVIQPYEVCFVNGYLDKICPSEENTGQYCLLSDSAGLPRKSLIIYSTGNFTTAMYTPLCRLGAIELVDLFKNPLTGKIDWIIPEMKLIFNTPSDPDNRSRKLMLWDDFIYKLEKKSPSKAAKIRKKIAVIFEVINK
jgi:poly-gamma-glutamate capsule biosynthesis protein CapA/YwtB (metallophosphatase superfamily)